VIDILPVNRVITKPENLKTERIMNTGERPENDKVQRGIQKCQILIIKFKNPNSKI